MPSGLASAPSRRLRNTPIRWRCSKAASVMWNRTTVRSIKISRLRLRFRDRNRTHFAGFDRDHAVLMLEPSLDQNEPLGRDDGAVPLEHLEGEDDVRDSGLVLKAQEDEAFGRCVPLSGDDACGGFGTLLTNFECEDNGM